jgi:hypothetical protein
MSNTGVFGLSGYNDKNLEGLIADKTREAFREYGYFGGTLGASRLDRIDYSNDTSTASFRKTIRAYGGATGNTNFGYFGGGYGGVSAVDRVNYSNDTAVEGLRGPLSLARWRFSATGNSNFGYFFGGAKSNVSNIVSTVDRINYSNDLATASVRGPLSLPKGFAGSSGNSNFGYYYGGTNSDIPASYTNIERINYSNDTTTASVRGLLVSGSGGDSATGNNNFGYIVTYTSTRVHRLDYSNDLSTTVHRAITNYAWASRGATGNSNFGYFGGGYTAYSFVERLDYSNDNTQTALRGPLSYSRTIMGATSSHSFGGSPISQYGVFAKPFGYFGGGFTSTPSTISRSTIDRVDYSNDTSITLARGPLNFARHYFSATSNFNFGYFGGGNPGRFSTVDRLDYSNDNPTTVVRGPLTLGRQSPSSTGNSNFGYFAGGITPVEVVSLIDRINYSNDSQIALLRSSLQSTGFYGSATGTSNFGYFSPGFPGINTSIDRITYSNDTANTSRRNVLTAAKYGMGATGNSNFGYFGGGSGPVSTVDRIDYSNDTATASVRGPLSLARVFLAATGNSNFGYFGGGSGDISTVDRIDYSNDTNTASVRGPLTLGRSGTASHSPTAFGGATDFTPTQQFFDIQSMRRIEDTTNASVKKRVLGSYGYFSRGIIQRLDYSNDTSIASVRGSLSTSGSRVTGTSNSNYSWINVGLDSSSALTSKIERIDYSNDLATTNLRGPLASAKRERSVANSSSFGYYIGGYPGESSTQRIDFSNDNVTALRRGNLNTVRDHANSSAVGNDIFGYVGGGFTPYPTVSTSIERLSYSNDSVVLSIRGPLTSNKTHPFGSGNSNFGYFGGSVDAAPTSTVDRIDYANDSATASVRGPLSSARALASATGNSNFGYVGGGINPSISPSIFSTTDRIDYSNDTATASIRGPLSSATYFLAATTNARSS